MSACILSQPAAHRSMVALVELIAGVVAYGAGVVRVACVEARGELEACRWRKSHGDPQTERERDQHAHLEPCLPGGGRENGVPIRSDRCATRHASVLALSRGSRQSI